MAEQVGRRFGGVRSLGRVVAYCLAFPVAIGVIGVLLLTQAVFSPRDLLRGYWRDKAGGRLRPLVIGLRMVCGLVAIAIALPLVIGINCIVVLRSPSGAWRDLKHRREMRRRWARLRAEGRVLDWEDAKKRVDCGSGTFVVETDGGDLVMGLWWIGENRGVIDPDGRMPSLTDEQFKEFLSEDRRRLEGAVLESSWVETPREYSPVDLLDEAGASANIVVEWPEIERVVLKAMGGAWEEELE